MELRIIDEDDGIITLFDFDDAEDSTVVATFIAELDSAKRELVEIYEQLKDKEVIEVETDAELVTA